MSDYKLFVRVKLVLVEHSRSLVKAHNCISVTIKNLGKIVKYLDCTANIYSTIAGNDVHSWRHQNCIISLLCAVQIRNTLMGCLKTGPVQK